VNIDEEECYLLTFSTIASDVIGECHVPYGAAFGLIVDKVKERRMLRRENTYPILE
jgi:hypothetical protein